MISNSESRRRLHPLTDDRLERLRHRVPLIALSVESGIPLSALSLAERGLRPLSSTRSQLRDEALKRLAGEEREKA